MSEFVFELLQLAGILAFAISGALVGVRRNLDMLGVAVVGGFTGVGGGVLRDLLLGVHPPISFVYWPNLAVAVGEVDRPKHWPVSISCRFTHRSLAS